MLLEHRTPPIFWHYTFAPPIIIGTLVPSIIGACVPSIIGAFVPSIIGAFVPSIIGAFFPQRVRIKDGIMVKGCEGV